jgi:hypothetical protein
MLAIWCLLCVCGLVSFMDVQYLMCSCICLVSHDYPFYESFVFYVHYVSQMTCEHYVFLVCLCLQMKHKHIYHQHGLLGGHVSFLILTLLVNC